MKTKIITILLLLLSAFAAFGQSGSLIIDELEWADANVGQSGNFATRPDMYTEHYRWGVLTACPTGWRLPSVEELKALNASGSTNAAAGERGNQVKGRFYGPNHATATLPNNMAGAIFLPLGGLTSADNEIVNEHSAGYYWSSTGLDSNGYALVFHNSYKDWSELQHIFRHSVGMSLRCVRPELPMGCVTVVGSLSGSGAWGYENFPAMGCITALGSVSGSDGWGYENFPPLPSGCITVVGNVSGAASWAFEDTPTPPTGCITAMGSVSGSDAWRYENFSPSGCVTAMGNLNGTNAWNYDNFPNMGCVTAVGNVNGTNGWSYDDFPNMGCVTGVGNVNGTNGWGYQSLPNMDCITAVGNVSGTNAWAFEDSPMP